MITIQFIIIGVILLFIYINVFWTQKIYYHNKFLFILILSAAIVFIAFLLARPGNKLDAINFGLIIFHYTWLLWLIKKIYKNVNSYLVKKRLLDVKFANKDFTCVNWDGDLPGSDHWWDEKRATKPSWLDHLITMLLFILPISITIPITYIAQNCS